MEEKFAYFSAANQPNWPGRVVANQLVHLPGLSGQFQWLMERREW